MCQFENVSIQFTQVGIVARDVHQSRDWEWSNEVDLATIGERSGQEYGTSFGGHSAISGLNGLIIVLPMRAGECMLQKLSVCWARTE